MIVKSGLGSVSLSENCRANCAKRKACELTRIRQAHLHPIEQHEVVPGSVSCLNGSSRPNAVLFRVAHIVIQSLKRMLRTRFFAHISQEVPKVSPRWIDRDSASAIPIVHPMIGVRRSPNHAFPGCVFCSAPRFSAVAVLLRGISQAPARLRVAVAQLCCGKIGFVSARTDAYPANQAGLFLGATNHDQLTKVLASEIQGASAKRSSISASARFRVPTPQLCASDQRDSSANTATFPFRRVGAALNNLQVVKLLSSKFHKVPLYMAAGIPARPTTLPFNGGMVWQS